MGVREYESMGVRQASGAERGDLYTGTVLQGSPYIMDLATGLSSLVISR